MLKDCGTGNNSTANWEGPVTPFLAPSDRQMMLETGNGDISTTQFVPCTPATFRSLKHRRSDLHRRCRATGLTGEKPVQL